jgi:hypothetical protein
MTNGTVSIEKRFEFFQDYIKTVLNLSAGSIVFSVTFLKDIVGLGDKAVPRTAVCPGLLVAGWAAFLVSVLSSLVYLYFHALASRDEDGHRGWLAWSAGLGVAGLFFGLALLAVFGWLNLPM